MKSPMFEAVILMGGFGTRLNSISKGVPKSMMPVGGAPFVYLLLKKLEASGCQRIILSLHYRAQEIKSQILRDKPVSCEIVFIIEETPLGTGGALKLAATCVANEHFIALNGDTYSSLNYEEFVDETKHKEFAIAGFKIECANRYGALNINKGLLVGITEKGTQGPAIINSGTYLLSKSSLSRIKLTKFSFEDSFIPEYLGRAGVHVFEGIFFDIGVPDDYKLACRYFQ